MGDTLNLKLEANEPKDFSPQFRDIVNRSNNLARRNESGLISEKAGSSVVVREDGQINLSSARQAQYKMAPNGCVEETSLLSATTTVRKKFDVDEFLVNEHKLNPALWELSEFRKVKLPTNQNAIVGNFTMLGSVLVKAWEPNLKRYVLIRRPCRMPMFGTILNVDEINSALKISDPTQINENIYALSSSGYQVNSLIKDSKSLIGKDGMDRSGTIRNQGAEGSGASGGGAGGEFGTSPGKTHGAFVGTISEFASRAWEAAKKIGAKRNVNPELVYGQWYHETGGFSSDLAINHYNFGGITQESYNPGMEQPDGGNYYMDFSSVEDYADYFERVWGPYIAGIQDSAAYARTLKNEGYYGASVQAYQAGIENGMNNLPGNG